MNELIIKQKTGFISYSKFNIFDKNKKLFYSDDFTDSLNKYGYVKFNLPLGKYYVIGNIFKLNAPIKFDLIKLPKPERNILKKKYKILFGENPNKCSIFYEKGIILFDKKLKDFPLYVLYFIYYHELGHLFYETEKFADIYSVNKLLKLGFNPSQIVRAPYFSLSNKNFERKKFVVNKLKEI